MCRNVKIVAILLKPMPSQALCCALNVPCDIASYAALYDFVSVPTESFLRAIRRNRGKKEITMYRSVLEILILEHKMAFVITSFVCNIHEIDSYNFYCKI